MSSTGSRPRTDKVNELLRDADQATSLRSNLEALARNNPTAFREALVTTQPDQTVAGLKGWPWKQSRSDPSTCRPCFFAVEM